MDYSAVVTIDPSTGERLESYPATTQAQIDATLDQAHLTAQAWRDTPVAARAIGLTRIASSLRRHRQELAILATREMGKPLADSLAEVEKCAWTCDWYAHHGPALLQSQEVETGAVRSVVTFAPLGVLFAIMPWNFPYWQVVRALAPAVMAGNVVVLKHAPSTTGCALELQKVVASAGVPEHLLSVIVAGVEDTPEVSRHVITDPRVAAVTLTGSTGAGRAVAAIAGGALKKTVLELGGSDPFIVLADADLEAAAKFAARSRFQNAGQSCIAAKRIIVEASVEERFVELLLAEVAELQVGDPMQDETTIGPLAREDLRDAVARQVRESVEQGAVVLAGGKPLDRPGFFMEPTVLGGVTETMPVLAEEVFGPAVPILTAADAEAAVKLANESPFGLGSSLWTGDLERGWELATRIDAGTTAVNGMVASDARMPFGGIKDSGYGRELSSYGLHEFVNVHSIIVEGPGGPAVGPARVE